MKWLLILIGFLLVMCIMFFGSCSKREGVCFFKLIGKVFSYYGCFFWEDGEMKVYVFGVYVIVGFMGFFVEFEILDEKCFGVYNYIYVIIDDIIEKCLLFEVYINVILFVKNFFFGWYMFVVCKDMESGMGVIGIKGIFCRSVFRIL